MDFSEKPILVFWETTRSCPLTCVHCRASAIHESLPGELSREEGMRLIDQVASFGKPSPTMVFTGGDPLMRRDLFGLLAHAKDSGVQFAVSPAVTKNLTDDALVRMRDLGVSSISISLDGASARTHDGIRGVGGTYGMTLERIERALELGVAVQVNTAVMKGNYTELPDVLRTIRRLGVKIWELFFLVKVGRGTGVEDLAPEECEKVCNFIYDASQYGVTVRCVEAPFVRRVASERKGQRKGSSGADSGLLGSELLRLNGEPTGPSTLRPKGTLDGDGVVFVGYDGAIHPGGLLPVHLGNAKTEDLRDVYRNSALLKDIRGRKLNGRCGTCDFREVCGGSRARAYSRTGDPLGSDPACIMVAHEAG